MELVWVFSIWVLSSWRVTESDCSRSIALVLGRREKLFHLGHICLLIKSGTRQITYRNYLYSLRYLVQSMSMSIQSIRT